MADVMGMSLLSMCQTQWCENTCQPSLSICYWFVGLGMLTEWPRLYGCVCENVDGSQYVNRVVETVWLCVCVNVDESQCVNGVVETVWLCVCQCRRVSMC